MDKTEPCGICNKDVLIEAYDQRRVPVWVMSDKIGPCHLECVTQRVEAMQANGVPASEASLE